MIPGDQSHPNRTYNNHSWSYGSRPNPNRAFPSAQFPNSPRRFRPQFRNDSASHSSRGLSTNFLNNYPRRMFSRPSYYQPYYYTQPNSYAYYPEYQYPAMQPYPLRSNNGGGGGGEVVSNTRADDGHHSEINGSISFHNKSGRAHLQTNRSYKSRFYVRKNTRRRVMTFQGKSNADDYSYSHSDLTAPDLNSDCNLRDKLVCQLRNSTYQCAICISEVRPTDPIWSCSVCFHIYHLSCTLSWAQKSKPERPGNDSVHQWRCPSCQTQYDACDDVLTYRCFCGRRSNPDYHPGRNTIPHGCDEICGKIKGRTRGDLGSGLSGSECTHPCTELCHPGPCPPCLASVILSCPCGQVQRQLICGDPNPPPCGQICHKSLTKSGNEPSTQATPSRCWVGFHTCLYPCHTGSCPPCIWVISTACYCGNENNDFICGSLEANRLTLSPESLQLLKNAALDFLAQLKPSCPTKTGSTSSIPNRIEQDSPDLPSLGQLVKAYSECNLTSQPNLLDPSQPRPRPVFVNPSFSCGKRCGRLLGCQLHQCLLACHPGRCESCSLDPVRCLTCPCGRVPLNKLVISGDIHGDRTSCTDPIPTCPNLCGRPHRVCGHPCPQTCHNGPCAPCQSTIVVDCRCGRSSKTLGCQQFTKMVELEGEFELRCERICKKEKACGRHKCTNKCCNETVHPCHEICGRKLACKQHTCEEPCHSNPCPSCWRGVIYTELSCRCGSTILEPPQPCGSSPPKCSRPCNRPHNCDHPVQHTCHQLETCPPCTVQLLKECIGGHGVQFRLPCFQPALSCGRLCNRQLPTCSHLCPRVCHAGPCLTSNDSHPDSPTQLLCTQPCLEPRPECGHPCNLACHKAKSLNCAQAAALYLSAAKTNGHKPKTPDQVACKVLVDLVCSCSKRKQQLPCYQVAKKILTLQQVNDKILESLPDRDIIKSHQGPLPLLACDETCSQPTVVEASNATGWERGLTALGLGLNSTTPTTSSGAFEPPEYSDFLKQFALNNFAFASSVERQLQNMVIELLKSSNTKIPSTDGQVDAPRTVSHRFAPSNKKRRQFIRELAEFYGIESFSFDPEPNRHVMVLAKRGCTKLPGGSLDLRASLINTLKRDFPKLVNLADAAAGPQQSQVAVPNRTNLPCATKPGFSYAQILKDRPTDS